MRRGLHARCITAAQNGDAMPPRYAVVFDLHCNQRGHEGLAMWLARNCTPTVFRTSLASRGGAAREVWNGFVVDPTASGLTLSRPTFVPVPGKAGVSARRSPSSKPCGDPAPLGAWPGGGLPHGCGLGVPRAPRRSGDGAPHALDALGCGGADAARGQRPTLSRSGRRDRARSGRVAHRARGPYPRPSVVACPTRRQAASVNARSSTVTRRTPTIWRKLPSTRCTISDGISSIANSARMA